MAWVMRWGWRFCRKAIGIASSAGLVYVRLMFLSARRPSLLSSRIHEAFGPAALGFALMQAAQRPGMVALLVPEHRAETVLPAGFRRILPPERVAVIRAGSDADLLWAVEEALRAAALGFVIAVWDKPLSLTQGRRLQLAAEAGRTTGILLIPEGGGSNAAETRWHCTPLWQPAESTLMRWSLIKNKKGTCESWVVRWDATAGAITVVSETGERSGAAPPVL